jgi:hypothetical protein
MKNLHLIATDKPSRLHLGNSGLVLCEFVLSKYTINGQHIYITNDEPIKEGDYGLSKLNEIIKFHSGYDYRYYAKIILTTDQDLIKDGVQPIDDEFLEWFVNNPSCEWVEVEDTCLEVKVCDCAMNENCLKPGYTIIIPKEELKQELNLNCFDCNKALQDCTCIEDTINMKQETLEEARKYAELSYYGDEVDVFVNGAKWQAEKMYSEEELLEFANWCRIQDNKYPNRVITIQQLFTQFKKK